MQKIKEFEALWEKRCYFDGIPDDIPDGLILSGRVPSYRAIAICILKNDHQLRGLGFGRQDSNLVKNLIEQKRREDLGIYDPQIKMDV